MITVVYLSFTLDLIFIEIAFKTWTLFIEIWGYFEGASRRELGQVFAGIGKFRSGTLVEVILRDI